MTGFARAEQTRGARHLCVEIRSLNHRHLQLKTRLPDALARFEADTEPHVRRVLQRGTVSISANLQTPMGSGRVRFDVELAQNYWRELDALRKELPDAPAPTLRDLLGLPGVVVSDENSTSDAGLEELYRETLLEALARLSSEREREGRALTEDLLARISGIESGLAAFEERYPEQQAAYENRLLERVRRFLQQEGHATADLDVVREVALYCEKIDVSEERTRLHAHLEEFRRLLRSEDAKAAIGRQLDFLVQEMLRETHTIGAKTVDGELGHLVLSMRAELERIKEQVQNLE